MSNGHSSPQAPSEFEKLCATQYEKVTAFLEEDVADPILKDVQEQSRKALDVLKEALTRYRYVPVRSLKARCQLHTTLYDILKDFADTRVYSFDDLCLSYNGGKDCLVLLILYLSALHAHTLKRAQPNDQTTTTTTTPFHLPQTLRAVYIISPHPFTQVDDFVNSSLQTYHLSLARYARSMKDAFADYLLDHPAVRAIFVGTRRTDPHGASLQPFDPTDRGWPAFMRVHPVIDWHYAEIWAFIRELRVEYCELYDMGYTSLGGTTDTHPNPALWVESAGGAGGGERSGRYRPAYELVEDEAERLGRDR